MEKLEEDKKKECKIVFDMFDKDKDGCITTNELGDVMRILGGAPSEQELEDIVSKLEESDSTLINFEKFLQMYIYQIEHQDREEDLIAEFAKMDKDQSGKISEDDLRNLMSNYENALESDDIEEILGEANIEDGYVDYARFAKVLLGKL